MGWVVGAGLKLNAPMIGQGDYFQAQVNYTEGAVRYVFQTPNTNWGKVDGNSAGWGVVSDAVFNGSSATGTGTGAPTGLELTTAWGVNAAYEHFWNPRWRTSLYGGYAAVNYNDTANTLLCGFGAGGIVTNGCDMDWSTWWIGSRTQWNVTKDFYMGLDVLYSKIQSATAFTDTTGTFALGSGTTPLPKSDVDNWAVRFRVHRDFYP